ncbi:hypothetical protein [Allokutzneria albata]|uniref:Uncharacterized protein n=1 Tax=Allokutzneria albata TaxID=211114 RepID=A0A1H0CLV3_ALLAB|nr:hypothetical protein [Allokutzneria albata]SDN58876.1 hypothetical protein SAMN04489726_7303 [Allokutzneria albata]
MEGISNPWVTGGAAVLAALIAFGGVALGQLMQSRRERQLRTDQWRREDRHRFADHKRELYAELLSYFDRWQHDIRCYDIEFNKQNKDSANFPIDWLDSANAPDGITEERRSIDLLLGRVRLVSNAIWAQAQAHVATLDDLTYALMIGSRAPTKEDWATVYHALSVITDAMRGDLGADEQEAHS